MIAAGDLFVALTHTKYTREKKNIVLPCADNAPHTRTPSKYEYSPTIITMHKYTPYTSKHNRRAHHRTTKDNGGKQKI